MNESMKWKPLLAELVGTFAFFVIGAGAICIDAATEVKLGLLGIALAHGLMLSNMVNVFGPVSGAHFNPAVTLGALVGKKIKAGQALLYVIAQLIGAVLAGYFLLLIFRDTPAMDKSLGTPMINTDLVNSGTAILIEAALTFFLVITVFATGFSNKAPNVPAIGGYGIGLTVTADILMGGPLTGAAMNPARVFGPALASGQWALHWIYWVGPLLGGLLAGLFYSRIFGDD
ncbi:MAG: aquaporin [Candidatus Poribacteria bacterium]|nr:aquaporin [Candidatus Poribacteria bacterium]